LKLFLCEYLSLFFRFSFIFILFLGVEESRSEISVQKDESSYLPLKVFAQSLNLVEEHYPKKKERKDLVHGAIRGMLFEIDPYSHLLTPKEVQDFYQHSQKMIEGFGISLAFKNNQVVVTSVFKNSNAAKRGVQVGDFITDINNKSVEKMSYDEVVHRIKKSDSLKFKVIRSQNQSFSFSLAKGSFQVPSLAVQKINDQFLYVRVLSFKENTYKALKQALDVQRKTKSEIYSKFNRGILLDLRQNSGGMVDQALLIADLFISEGLLISIQGKQTSQKFYAKSLGTLKQAPLVVLIDEYSASASEILASSLKENERAFIVGKKSFGKGSIQTLFDLENGYALKLTVSEYFSPQGNSIEKKGVEPHLVLNSQTSLTEEEILKIDHFKYNFFSKPPSFKPIGPIRTQWKKLVEKDVLLEKSFKVLQQLTL